MSSPAARLAAAIAVVLLAAGCASPPAVPAAPAPAAPPATSLNTSLGTTAGTWATVVMGGSAAQDNAFWQLFIRPAGSTRWKLITPPGTADNGGLVLAGRGPGLVTGFRPSQDLTFSPLIQTSNGGQAWSSLNPLDAGLASAPDALAAQPSTGQLLALLADGTAEQAPASGTTWAPLTSQHALAATAPGRRCGLKALTAVSYTPAGTPVLAGTCTRPGTVGIFTAANQAWQSAGPPLPAALTGQDITVYRLTRTAYGLAALLQAGTGPGAALLAAWSADGRHWTVSPALRLHGASVTSASFGPDGTAAITTTAHQGQAITPGSNWQPLPPVPSGTATLVPGPDGTADALAVDRGTLTIWQHSTGSSTWTRTQVINVPIPYGSSS